MQSADISTKDVHSQIALLVLVIRLKPPRLEQLFENIFQNKKANPKVRFFEEVNLNYFNKLNTDCDDWLACANMAVAACWMICDLAKLVVSEA
jgi:hypothetical protein